MLHYRWLSNERNVDEARLKAVLTRSGLSNILTAPNGCHSDCRRWVVQFPSYCNNIWNIMIFRTVFSNKLKVKSLTLYLLYYCVGPAYGTINWSLIQTIRLILVLRPANERRCYFVTASLIGWMQTLNRPWYHILGCGMPLSQKEMTSTNELPLIHHL